MVKVVIESLIENNNEIGKPLPKGAVYNKSALFLKGENSDYILLSEKMVIDIHFPQNKVVEISRAGHWLHAENPRDFYKEVCSFLIE